MLAAVKIEGQPKKKRIIRPGSPAESESDDSSSSSDASGEFMGPGQFVHNKLAQKIFFKKVFA